MQSNAFTAAIVASAIFVAPKQVHAADIYNFDQLKPFLTEGSTSVSAFFEGCGALFHTLDKSQNFRGSDFRKCIKQQKSKLYRYGLDAKKMSDSLFFAMRVVAPFANSADGNRLLRCMQPIPYQKKGNVTCYKYHTYQSARYSVKHLGFKTNLFGFIAAAQGKHLDIDDESARYFVSEAEKGFDIWVRKIENNDSRSLTCSQMDKNILAFVNLSIYQHNTNLVNALASTYDLNGAFCE